ncbi:hypothetical protein KIW84_042990 [Lathyrus oleraceus]|uniref:non-specific serine/threonine protein kinase n=1 Tax=Pisum sativum TaxID=3888 RepID=A0A9D4XGP3_PEA|nr:hypothetical protein KIW84_042990 [Pisum sativum]
MIITMDKLKGENATAFDVQNIEKSNENFTLRKMFQNIRQGLGLSMLILMSMMVAATLFPLPVQVNLAATVILPFSLCCNSKLFSWSQTHEEEKRRSETPICINAFELIGMSSSLDLSGLFENEDVSERKIRFTTNLSAKDLMKKIEDSVADMEFRVQKKNGKIKVIQENKEHKTPGSLSVTIEVVDVQNESKS